MLVALHDPGSVLAATIAAQAGTAEDDAGTVAQPDTEGRRETVNMSADDIEDPLTQAMVRQFGEDLVVHVWFGSDNGDDDIRVEQIAYALPPTTGSGTGAGMGRFVVVDFDNLGNADEIELPDQDEVRDIDLAVFTGAVAITVLPALDTDTGTDTDTD